MSEAKRGRGRPAGVFQAGSVNARLAALAVGDVTVWLTDDPGQPVRWQRQLTSRSALRGVLADRRFATESAVLVAAGGKVEYALKVWRIE